MGVVREQRVGVESLDETGVFLLIIIGGNIVAIPATWWQNGLLPAEKLTVAVAATWWKN